MKRYLCIYRDSYIRVYSSCISRYIQFLFMTVYNFEMIQGTRVQAPWCFIFHASSLIPPGRCRLVRGGRNFNRGGRSCRGGCSCSRAVALRASGGFPLLSLGSWPHLPAAQWSEQRRCLGGIRTGKPMEGDARLDRLCLPSWGCPRSRREQGWFCLGRLCALVMSTSRIFHRMTSHCVLWIDWFSSIVVNWSALITFSENDDAEWKPFTSVEEFA